MEASIMESILSYILISTICLSIFYLGFRIFQRKETKLSHLRIFLLASIITSLLLPLSKVSIDVPEFMKVNIKTLIGSSGIYSSTKTYDGLKNKVEVMPQNVNNRTSASVKLTKGADTSPESAELRSEKTASVLNWLDIIIKMYFLITAVMLLRLLFSLVVLFRLYIISVKKLENGFVILVNKSIEAPFSFFSLVFIPNKMAIDDDYREIVSHEKVHASQYHSIDIILIEFLSAVMWFNPFVWMMRSSVQLVHEYLADEGVLNTGIDRLQYQALLVNQVAEESLICLSSGFHQSQIKKRIIMMTKNKPDQNPKLRILYLLPIVLLLFIGVAYINGQKNVTVANNVPVAVKKITSEPKSKFYGSFTEEHYDRLIKDRMFIMLGDRFISKKEYLSIDANNVESITMTGRYGRGLLMSYLKRTSPDNYAKFETGNYSGGIVISLKGDNKVSDMKSKISSWFNEKGYDGVVKDEVSLVMVEDKVIRTKEEFLDINPLAIDSLFLFPPEDSLKLKSRIKRNRDEYVSISKKGLAMLVILKKEKSYQ